MESGGIGGLTLRIFVGGRCQPGTTLLTPMIIASTRMARAQKYGDVIFFRWGAFRRARSIVGGMLPYQMLKNQAITLIPHWRALVRKFAAAVFMENVGDRCE